MTDLWKVTISLAGRSRKAKTATPKESEIRAQVKEFLEWQGWFVFYHLQGLGSYPGLPDLQAVKDGRTIYIEIKRPGGRQSVKQKKFQQDLEAAGGVYIIAQGLESITAYLECCSVFINTKFEGRHE